MPRASTTCSTPGCPNLRDECPEHRKIPWKGSTRRKRLPKGWTHIRASVLRQQKWCAICKTAPATVCDHIVPGDDHRRSNLQGICARCDRIKSAQEGNRARNALRG